MCTTIYITRGTTDNAAPLEKIIKKFVAFTDKCHTENLQHSNLLQSTTGEFHKETKPLHSRFSEGIIGMLNYNHRICTSFRVELAKITKGFHSIYYIKESTVFGQLA